MAAVEIPVVERPHVVVLIGDVAVQRGHCVQVRRTHACFSFRHELARHGFCVAPRTAELRGGGVLGSGGVTASRASVTLSNRASPPRMSTKCLVIAAW